MGVHGELSITVYACMASSNLYHVLQRAKKNCNASGEQQHSAEQDYIEASRMFQFNNHIQIGNV